MTAITDWSAAMMTSLAAALAMFLSAIPKIIGFAVILIVAWLLSSLVETLDRAHSVESLAARAHMSPRTFARRFRAETGTTPHDWLTGQRVLLARQLLEDTDLGVDAIAGHCGFGTAAMLRHHFTKCVFEIV